MQDGRRRSNVRRFPRPSGGRRQSLLPSSPFFFSSCFLLHPRRLISSFSPPTLILYRHTHTQRRHFSPDRNLSGCFDFYFIENLHNKKLNENRKFKKKKKFRREKSKFSVGKLETGRSLKLWMFVMRVISPIRHPLPPTLYVSEKKKMETADRLTRRTGYLCRCCVSIPFRSIFYHPHNRWDGCKSGRPLWDQHLCLTRDLCER